MATTCRNCGALLPEGMPQCPSCLAFDKPQSFFQRIFGRFNVKLQGTVSTTHAATTGSRISIKTAVKHCYKIRDAATGEIKEYHSLDEIPAPYREKMSHALEQGQVVKSQAISFTGPDGVTHTFRSLDEVPADIRALIERAEKSSG